jgi:DNA-binding transcriptional ArsR family regulator
MDKADLERWLAEGQSLEAIGELTGRHPSTVGYWLRKHGLTAVHRDKHAAKGPVAHELLAALVARGLSMRAIGRELGLSQAAVRHWLGVYGLETARTIRNRRLASARAEAGGDVEVVCPRHGHTRHAVVDGRGLRCCKCRSEAVAARRRKVKATLVDEAGGACGLCGYDRHVGALQFHHVDRATKDFSIAHRGVGRSLDRARSEVAKCVLLCANCHAEVEAGVAKLPAVVADDPK